MRIPFNKPYMTGKELGYIAEAHANSHLAGDGAFTRKCSGWLEAQIGCRKALLTHSCTAALEMAAILADLQPGDEVIMPSFTFVSTANAFVLRGAIPVFVDVRPDTFNIDESKIETAITARTRAIVPVHYAGVGCEMDAIMDIAERHGLIVIEDAAQGVMSRYKGRPLGSIGHLACLSFHETKNLSSGEGGALLINDPVYALRAEIIREKGTNRSQFFRGQVDKYTWCDLGSSYLPSELNAAFLMAQMEEAQDITLRRLQLWQRYHEAFAELEQQGRLRRPQMPASCGHNAHMYYLLLPDLQQRTAFIEAMRARDIGTVFHYVPLHSAPAGQRYGRAHDGLAVTQSVAERLVRLPLWVGLESDIDEVISSVVAVLGV
ncbi:dTDP-4-amino-4,6-dideoxygalactose transaminase [Aquipseudomonas alcaligenes]|uniref:Aminotransferase n=1 Tax=Aquipseudomonas alcaligenes (strain ATCC 14909 / DSM 50342 / CCUG 1425 / JCM 20561 / NBRC 14159 / NCIMB 9945 / NCTC 10367 / 1577) TaxID=1215092 RepID=U3BDW1_AQUA1|nr:dTDP-4-amino-4,6-dideoxygalactose transaminase [Pseudomonas alcaligenes]GAD64963.1 putative aminotransferase [Pseudomonas alcaligenes NBRC 14159]SUD19558.1 TDP-4-oxo-6-deoxy-D-glucose transaminase [Pseudomonas alcaligenes]